MRGPDGSRGRSARLLEGLGWVPVVLAVLAEAAWISIVAGLVQEFALREPVVNLGGFTLLVGLGVVAGRRLAPRTRGSWPAVALLLVAAGAVAGWLSSADARAGLVAGNLAVAIGANPGGFAAGLAILRGFAHAGEHLGAGTIGRMVFAGIPILGILAAVGGMIAEPWRGQFLAGAGLGAAVFVACGLLALAFAGFAEVERSGAPTWRGNPAWIGLLLVAVALLVATAIPVAITAGPAIAGAVQLVIGVAIVPFAVVGLVTSGGAGLRRILGFVVVGAVIVWILSLTQPGGPLDDLFPETGDSGTGARPPVDDVGLVGIGVIAVVLVAAGIALLARAWLRRRPRDETGDLGDERSFELPEIEASGGGPRPHRRRRLGTPASATEAYLHLVADLADRRSVRRYPGETPAEHAHRVRLSGKAGHGGGALGLDLLAADYGLAAFGGVSLSEAETRRAIGRWRTLRRRLGRDGSATLAEVLQPDEVDRLDRIRPPGDEDEDEQPTGGLGTRI
jgi:hypothetical protein